MKRLSLDKRKQWKKTGILLCGILLFVLLVTGFLGTQSPAKAESLDKEEPSLVSRVLLLGEGTPVDDHRKEELEQEQKEIQEKREQKREEENRHRTEKGSSQDTSPKGTAADSGSSGVGGAGGSGGPQDEPPSGNEGNDPEGPTPGGDDPSKLPLIYSTLRNGDSWNGPSRNFTVYADDYQGRHIKRGSFDVYANGKKLYSSGDQYNANYRMDLLEGTNHVSITVTDTFGVSATREYTFTGHPNAQPKEEGTVYITLDMRTLGAGYVITNYPVMAYAGENLSDVVVRALEANGYSVGYTGSLAYGFYLKSIGKSGLLSVKQNCVVPPPILAKLEEINASEMGYNQDDRLMEKEIYAGSGWVYFHNGEFYEGQGMSDILARRDDEITIAFTLHNGYEYNGTWFNGNW
jgi:hypothetical protein